MRLRPPYLRAAQSAFTMIEIAISLAIIGIALVAIIGVLPLGMNVQRDNREQTVINQDATVFINAISQGARGLDDLTNYVYAVTNYQTHYIGGLAQATVNVLGYNYYGSSTIPPLPINNGTNIIGLLSAPQFADVDFNPTNNLLGDGYSNHVIAYVRSLSGAAVEKPPQDNQIIQADAFGYRLLCVNAAVATDTNAAALKTPYNKQLAANLHELRLTFLWPTLPSGGVGNGRQTYRTTVGGQVFQAAYNNSTNQWLYFFQSQSFLNSP